MDTVLTWLKDLQLHPVADHFTIGILVIAVLIDLAASMAQGRRWIRLAALLLMIIAAVAAAASWVTGGWEAHRVWDAVSGPAKEVLEWHAQLGYWLMWTVVALAAWRILIEFLSFIAPSRKFYLLIAVAAGVVMIYQGHEGGELVYEYGVGTALMGATPVAASPPAGGEAAAAAEAPAPASAASPATAPSPTAATASPAGAPSPSIEAEPPAPHPPPASISPSTPSAGSSPSLEIPPAEGSGPEPLTEGDV